MMSSLSTTGCCAMIALMVAGCGPRLTPAPERPRAQARNGETHHKKKIKRRPPLVAPPPAYGNKIVQASADAPYGPLLY